MKSLLVFKALADESRLAIYQLLLEREAYSEVLAERLKLAPSTVSFHLKKLSDAGLVTSFRDQYYTVFRADKKFADSTLKSLAWRAEVNTQAHDQVEQRYQERTLKSFFKYGKLVKIPAQKMKRDLVLARVVESFQPKRDYSPQETESLLGEIFSDARILLKELKSAGLLEMNEGFIRRANKSQGSF